MRANQFNYLLKNLGSSKVEITPRQTDFPKWFQNVIEAADLAEHGPSKGSMIIKPYGYAIWENIKKELDARIREAGVPNLYFPLFIPEGFLHREAQHVEGFSPEVAVVTHAGGKELEEKLVVRPTSETIMYDTFSRWISSYRDLPLLVNQWANVVRWEMRPRLFLRSTEFLWQEGHTAHASEKEANDFALAMLDLYNDVAQNVMAIATIAGEKTEAERFAGAHRTYTLEPMMQDGKALQFATSHNLGDNFARAFNVFYENEKGDKEPVWQTSWGMSTRSIGGLIMSHSDDKGLVLPPNLAPLNVVITTVGQPEKAINEAANKMSDEISQTSLVDNRDMSPGEKFYSWEKRGVPIRVEIGPRDLAGGQAIMVLRDTGEKKIVELAKVAQTITQELASMQQRLYTNSQERLSHKVIETSNVEEAIKLVQDGNFALASFIIDSKLEKKLSKEHGITVRCHPFESPKKAILAKAY